MDKNTAPSSIDDYIAGYPPEIRDILTRIRALIRRIVAFRVRENLARAAEQGR